VDFSQAWRPDAAAIQRQRQTATVWVIEVQVMALKDTNDVTSMSGGPRNPWLYSSKDGFEIKDGKIRVFGFSVQPSEPLRNPRVARRTPARLKLQPGRYSWCACGRSNEQPFCDNSHREIKDGQDWRSYKFQVLEEVEVTLCRCKRTQSPPFCDCQHEHVP
jgi:CDGSH-type Zn-finger protein